MPRLLRAGRCKRLPATSDASAISCRVKDAHLAGMEFVAVDTETNGRAG